MTVGDILVSINQASLETMLPLTAVQTSADIERYYKEGYSIGITATEFAKKYPRLPVGKIYAAHNMLAPLYYCEFDSTTVPIVLSLNIYGDKRLAVNSESDEKFQQRVLGAAENISTGNAPFIRSYLFSLEDSLRVSVLSRYIELSNPDEDLYSLFLDLYRTSDFGFSALKEDDLQKVFAGKSQKQKQDTIKRLSSLPDVVTIYRGEGSKSTPYEKSFSWTTSYKAACFFACRIPSLENSRIITAHINKSDIIEYFPDDEEKEVLIPPAAVKDVKADVLLGINALTDEIQALYPLYQRYRSRIFTLYDAYGRANDEEHDAEHTLRVLFDALLLVQVQGIALTKKNPTSYVMQFFIMILGGRMMMSMTVTEQSLGTFIMTQPPTAIRQLLSSSSIIAWMTARLLQTSKHPIFETKNGCGCYIRFSRMQMPWTVCGSECGPWTLSISVTR